MKKAFVKDVLESANHPRGLRHLPDKTRDPSASFWIRQSAGLLIYLGGLSVLYYYNSPVMWLQAYALSLVSIILFDSKPIAFLAALFQLMSAPSDLPIVTASCFTVLPLFMMVYVRRWVDLALFGFLLSFIPPVFYFFTPDLPLSPLVQGCSTLGAAFLGFCLLLQHEIKDKVLISAFALFLAASFFVPFLPLSLIFLLVGYLLAHPFYFAAGVTFHLFLLSFLLYRLFHINDLLAFLIALLIGLFYLFAAFRIKKYGTT